MVGTKSKLEAIRAHEGAKLRQHGKDMVHPAMAAIIESAPDGSPVKSLWSQLQVELQKSMPSGQSASTEAEDYVMDIPEIESDSESEDEDESDDDCVIKHGADKVAIAKFNAEQKKKKEAAKAKREERKNKQKTRTEQNGKIRAASKGIKDAGASK